MKHGKPINFKDKNPWKWKGTNHQSDHDTKENSQEEIQIITNEEIFCK